MYIVSEDACHTEFAVTYDRETEDEANIGIKIDDTEHLQITEADIVLTPNDCKRLIRMLEFVINEAERGK